MIWDHFREKESCYKNVFRLNRYNFGRVNGIDFPFATLHNTPSLYVNVNVHVYFRVLHKLSVDVDYPWGSKLPHLQVGASNSFQTQCVGRGVLSLLGFSVLNY